MQDVNWTALTVFVVLFAFITWLGFAAARWRKGDLDQLHEWGLGGRRFGTVITWFLIGGDLYTAYTFIAVPALAFGAGAIAFFAVPYTIMIYPILFLVFPRLWQVCHKHNYITPADFVRGRFGNRWLALAVTITGIVATMPYIALQLVGLQVVIAAMGVSGTGYIADVPLLIAFIILAAFTYSSGLRAPASIAVVKDILIYITAIRRRDRGADPDGRLRPYLRGGAAGESAAGDAARQLDRRLRLLRDAGARLGAGAVSLSAFDHRHFERFERTGDPPQRGAVAGLFVRARAVGAGRLLRHRGGRREPSGIRRRLQTIRHQFLDPGAVPAQLPVLVRRRRLCGGRHRRAGAGGDHVDRGGEPLHPQHPSRVHQPPTRPTARKPRSPNGCRWWSSSAR